jgi:hypothetical protein
MKTFKCILLAFFFIIVILNIFSILNGLICPKEVKLCKKYERSLLVHDSTKTITCIERDALLKSLSKKIDNKLSYYARILTANIALLAIILIPLLSNKGNNQLVITFIAFCLFFSFYLFDIHTIDLDSRQMFNECCYNETAVELSNISTNNCFKYDINDEIREERYKQLTKKSFIRKVCNYVHPGISQISFYLIPITLILGYILFISINIFFKIRQAV